MRLAFVTLLLVAPGCVAHHRIVMESEPPGAHVEMNGEYLGETPIVYILESPYAETIWPDEARLVARQTHSGWKPEVKHFDARSPLPGRIFFILEKDELENSPENASENSPRSASDVSNGDAGGDAEYETLEEQKRRLQSRQNED